MHARTWLLYVPLLCAANKDAQALPPCASRFATMFLCHSMTVPGLISAKLLMLYVPMVVSITASP